jgi:hypothetical protein
MMLSRFGNGSSVVASVTITSASVKLPVADARHADQHG